MIRILLMAIVMTAFVNSAPAAKPQEPEVGPSQELIDDFIELVRANTHEVKFDGERASGEGIDWLIEEGRQAQYFLIGERHGLAEVPKISGDIFELLMANGYSRASLEFSPFAADRVEEHLNEGGYQQLVEYLSAGPSEFGPVAFLDWVEEAEMAARLHALSPIKTGFFWGLDQEIFGSFGAHLHFLRENSTNDEQLAAVVAMEKLWISNPFQMIQAKPAEIRALTNLFRDSNNPNVIELLDMIEFGNHIYGHFADPSRITRAQSNVDRENYMKDTFMRYLRQAQHDTGEDPKVFFKYGGFHSAPFLDRRYGSWSLGGFIEEFARSNQHTAFNLYLDCASGLRRSSGQDQDQVVDQERHCNNSFGPIDVDAPWDENKNIFSEFLKDPNAIFLIDFRPIRLQLDKFGEILGDTEISFISGFDAYMAIPNVTTSAVFERGE